MLVPCKFVRRFAVATHSWMLFLSLQGDGGYDVPAATGACVSSLIAPVLHLCDFFCSFLVVFKPF